MVNLCLEYIALPFYRIFTKGLQKYIVENKNIWLEYMLDRSSLLKSTIESRIRNVFDRNREELVVEVNKKLIASTGQACDS